MTRATWGWMRGGFIKRSAMRFSFPAPPIRTKKNYKDFHLLVEFRLMEPDANSGIYIHRRYEVQIDNTFEESDNKYMGGSIYRYKLPAYNMGKALGEWQSYDIIFRSPRFVTNEFVTRKVEDARITVIHNGIVIHNNVIVHNKTGAGFPETSEPGPIMLQDHGSQVQYRNIWIVSNKKDHRYTNLTDFSKMRIRELKIFTSTG